MKKIIAVALFALSVQFSFGQWNTDRIMNIGQNALYYEDYVLAIQYFNQVIKIKPYLAEPYMFRAIAKINLGDYLGAEQDCNEAIKLNPFIPYAYYTRGFARKNLGKYKDAIDDFNKSLQYSPDNPDYVANRIEAKEKNKDYKGAIDDLKYFKKINPKAKGIDFEMGRLMLEQNDTIGAEKMVMDNIKNDSTMEQSYLLLAHIKEKKKDVKGAINDLLKLKKINSKSEYVNVELGRLYLEVKDTISALNAFNDAVNVDPNKPYAYSARAFLKMMKKDEKGALDDYSKAIEKGSEFAGDYINRGILNVKKYNFNQALNDYNYAILLDRSNSLSYYNRALLRNNLGDKNNALSDLNRVIELDPQNYEALLQKANLELELGQLDESIRDFETILKTYKYFAPAYYSISEALEKKGNKKAADNYKSLVFEIINNKDYYKKKQQLEAKNQMVKNPAVTNLLTSNETIADKLASQTGDKLKKSDYPDKLRGKVQENYAELTYLPNAELTFNPIDSVLSNTNRFHEIIQNYNNRNKRTNRLTISIETNAANANNVQTHFSQIEKLSEAIKKEDSNADFYLARAIEFSTVQDFNSAMEDLNKAIELNEKFALAYFMRGNIRIKTIDSDIVSNSNDNNSNQNMIAQVGEKNRLDKLKVLEDYNKVIELNPDFTFVYYNKGNFLASFKDYGTSIENYTKAIEIDPSFSEAYFGRGLSYIFLNDENSAKKDLSKAGELGIYKAYNLLNRLLSTTDKSN